MAVSRSPRRTGGAIAFDLDVTGVEGLSDVLRALPLSIRNKIAQPIVQKLVGMGARTAQINIVRVLPRRDPAKRRWDRPTGALRDSMGAKVVPISRMRNKNIVFGLYGARSDFRVNMSTARNIANNRDLRRRRFGGVTQMISGPLSVGRIKLRSGRTNVGVRSIQPAKYAHLVEGGHVAVPQFNIPAASPRPFMAPTRQAIAAIMPGVVSRLYNEGAQRVFAAEVRRAQRPSRVSGYRSSMNARRS